MGSKHNPKKTKPVPADPAQEVKRLIEKGNFKDAVKQAKLCFRDEGSTENRRLLEQAYFLRARQLLGRAMSASAREVAGHLLEFGVSDPALVADTAALLVSLGMTQESLGLQERLDSPEVKERLQRQVADQAVLHPERSADQSPELRDHGARVRAALEALSAGDEAGMVEQLRMLPRSSPLADWKLFARGLAAFYRGAVEDARANWDRLDPDRAAARIARVLLGRAEGAREAKVPAALEKQVFGEPVIAALEQLRELVVQERWTDAVGAIVPLKYSLRRIDPALSLRLTRVFYGSIPRVAEDLSYARAKALVDRFIKVAEPLPIDPRWNRLWALLWEGPRGDAETADSYWRLYIKDLQQLAFFRPEERALAQALVLNKMADDFLNGVEDLSPDEDDDDELDHDPSDDEHNDKLAEQWVGEAVGLLEESLAVCPTHLPTYIMLGRAHLTRGRETEAVAVANRLLERFPDHVETLKFLATYYLNHHPARGLELIRRIRQIKPLDQDLVGLERYAHVESARAYALERRFEQGRAELAAADAMGPAPEANFLSLVKKAAFELKAGQDESAEGLIAEAEALLEEPTPLWLALEIEARRYALPRARIKLYADRFKAAIKAKRKGKPSTAKLLADLVRRYVEDRIAYTGRDTHVREVRTYLNKNSGLKFSHDELRSVCEFLVRFPYRRKTTLQELVERGWRAHPNSPYFLYLLASIQLKRSRWAFLMHPYRKDLEKALELAQASSDPKDAALVPRIKSELAKIVDPPGFGLPLPRFGPSDRDPADDGPKPSFFDFLDPFDDDDDYDDFDDDDDDDPGPRRGGWRRR
jgi:tetratricopeptide (TPR) repeat protein